MLLNSQLANGCTQGCLLAYSLNVGLTCDVHLQLHRVGKLLVKVIFYAYAVGKNWLSIRLQINSIYTIVKICTRW